MGILPITEPLLDRQFKPQRGDRIGAGIAISIGIGIGIAIAQSLGQPGADGPVVSGRVLEGRQGQTAPQGPIQPSRR